MIYRVTGYFITSSRAVVQNRNFATANRQSVDKRSLTPEELSDIKNK